MFSFSKITIMKTIIAANWKMHKTQVEVDAFFSELLSVTFKTDVWVAPSAPYLSLSAKLCKGYKVLVGAQNIYFEKQGAFTGEISAEQVADCGGAFAIVGHSERRRLFGETDEDVKKKIHAAVSGGLIPLVCIGETLEERKDHQTAHVLKNQLKVALDEHFEGVIAYEPVWAIGTGQIATREMIEEAHRNIRKILTELCRKGAQLPILYGGSVTPETTPELAKTKYVDGLLVGGASLKAQSFLSIIRGFRP
jgi:triosephosphate isomerase (TIM)